MSGRNDMDGPEWFWPFDRRQGDWDEKSVGKMISSVVSRCTNKRGAYETICEISYPLETNHLVEIKRRLEQAGHRNVEVKFQSWCGIKNHNKVIVKGRV